MFPKKLENDAELTVQGPLCPTPAKELLQLVTSAEPGKENATMHDLSASFAKISAPKSNATTVIQVITAREIFQ